MDEDKMIAWLAHYGYLAGNVQSMATDASKKNSMVSDALKRAQESAGLPATGTLDSATEAKFSQSRCGCLDVEMMREWARWRKNSLTYFIEKRVPNLPDVDELISLAWQDWMNVADFRIVPATSPNGADIIISTGSGRADGFDGPSGTLAWAYLPNGTDGQLLCRFDLGETWKKDSPQGGILFRNVACHEFGHLLGLEHSRVSSALMAPFYNPAVVSPRQTDDIPRIVALYGKPPAPPPPPPPVPLPNMIRLGAAVAKGQTGTFVAGSDMGAGDYLALLGGDGPPPAVPGS